MPADPADPGYDRQAHRAAFSAFLTFLKANLAGQTAVRVDPDWATQVKTVEGFAEFVLPDRLIRQDRLAEELGEVLASAGMTDAPPAPEMVSDKPFALADVYDAEIEKLARAAYGRDYLMFGFKDWA